MIVRDFQGNKPLIEFNKNFLKLTAVTVLEKSFVVKINYLKSKRIRMETYKKQILQKIAENNILNSEVVQIENDNFENEISIDNEENNDSITGTSNTKRETATFCKNFCFNCRTFPKYKEMMLNGIKPNQTEVKHELSLHNHPSCRRFNKNQQRKYGLQRSADQGRDELLEHYKHCH